ALCLLSLHDALPISAARPLAGCAVAVADTNSAAQCLQGSRLRVNCLPTPSHPTRTSHCARCDLQTNAPPTDQSPRSPALRPAPRSEEHTSELQSREK